MWNLKCKCTRTLSWVQTLFPPKLRSNVDLRVEEESVMIGKAKQIFSTVNPANVLIFISVWKRRHFLLNIKNNPSSPECCCMWSNLLSQSTFTCTSWPTSSGEDTKCTASGPCLVTLSTGTSPINPWSSGWWRTKKHRYEKRSVTCFVLLLIWDESQNEQSKSKQLNKNQEYFENETYLTAALRKQNGVF